jgi:hypothetical protein
LLKFRRNLLSPSPGSNFYIGTVRFSHNWRIHLETSQDIAIFIDTAKGNSNVRESEWVLRRIFGCKRAVGGEI